MSFDYATGFVIGFCCYTTLCGSGDAGEVALQSEAKESTTSGVARKSTRMWAQQTGYEPEKIFHKVGRIKATCGSIEGIDQKGCVVMHV